MPDKRLDAELDLRAIVGFGIGLAAVMVAVAALMWWLSLALRDRVTANDTPLPALLEAQTQELPPEPRLQSDPIGDLGRLRHEESEALSALGWVDREAGIVTLPIETAMAAVAESGTLPDPTAPRAADADRPEGTGE